MRRVIWIVCALALLALGGGAAFVFALPSLHARGEAAVEVSDAERAALLAELRPPKRARPVIAVLANNSGSETTDFLVPYGVLRESGVADVLAVGMSDEPVTLMPALRIRPQLDVAKFDATHPDGADFVIVPALHDPEDAAVGAWLQKQARSGATIVGICDGAWVLGAAGLLDGHSATTHWYSRDRLRKEYPTMTWVPDRRWVADRRVVTTTGVTASIPFSLTLVEAIAGRGRADELARELGVPSYGSGHSSAAFALDRGAAWTAVRNTLAFWSHETLAVRAEPGVDEISLALTADAYSRTYASSVRTVAAAPEVVSRGGLTLLADEVTPEPGAREIPLAGRGQPALDGALDGIARRFDPATADFVALQLEYDRPVKAPTP